MATMTIYDIKKIVKNAGSHFFDYDMMRFFGDTMRSFGVKKIDGMFFVYRKKDAPVDYFFRDLTADEKKSVWAFRENMSDLFRLCNNSPLYGMIYDNDSDAYYQYRREGIEIAEKRYTIQDNKLQEI